MADLIFYTSLRSQADPNLLQANPTLAAGDVKIVKDDANEVNITTLPTVINSGKVIKVTVAEAEIGARTAVVFSDAAGDQWCDLTINIPTKNQVQHIWDYIIEGTRSVAKVFRLITANGAGITEGGGSAEIKTKSLDGTKIRGTYAIDANGNRTGFTEGDLT